MKCWFSYLLGLILFTTYLTPLFAEAQYDRRSRFVPINQKRKVVYYRTQPKKFVYNTQNRNVTRHPYKKPLATQVTVQNSRGPQNKVGRHNVTLKKAPPKKVVPLRMIASER